MKDGGSIILNSSIAGVKGFPGTSVYSASKAAVRSFARTWTAELKGKIRVNVISPGTIDTAMFGGFPQEMKDGYVSIIPMGRMGKPVKLLPLRSFWHPMIPASLQASSCSSMAAQRRSKKSGSKTSFPAHIL